MKVALSKGGLMNSRDTTKQVKAKLWTYRITFPKRKFLDFTELKEFTDDNLDIDVNGRTFFERVENTVGKSRNCS